MHTAETVNEQPMVAGNGPIGRIQISPGIPNTKLKAFATVNYAGIVLKDMRVLDSEKGLFVRPASYKSGDRYVDAYYIADQVVRTRIEAAVLEAYQKASLQPA